MPKGKISEEQVTLQMDRLWRPVFEKYDCDGDGYIELDDFRRMIHTGNAHLQEDIPRDVLDEILERSDWDRNRKIDYKDFLNMIHAHDLGAHQPRLQRLIRYAAVAVVPRCERQSVIRRYIDQYDCYPPPLFIILVTIAEVAFYIYYSIQLEEFSPVGPVPFESPLIYDPCKRKEIWRYFTYAFIHAGFIHMFFNCLVQLMLGIPLEMVHKWWRIGLVYILGVIAGSMGASISDPNAFLAGASGGVYALLAAHLSTVIVNWKEMDYNWVRLLALFVFGGTDVGVAVYERYWRGTRNKTSYAAHLTGALAGFLVGIVCLRNLKVRRWEVILGWVALIIYLCLTIAAISYNLFNTSHFPDEGHPLCIIDRPRDRPEDYHP